MHIQAHAQTQHWSFCANERSGLQVLLAITCLCNVKGTRIWQSHVDVEKELCADLISTSEQSRGGLNSHGVGQNAKFHPDSQITISDPQTQHPTLEPIFYLNHSKYLCNSKYNVGHPIFIDQRNRLNPKQDKDNISRDGQGLLPWLYLLDLSFNNMDPGC